MRLKVIDKLSEVDEKIVDKAMKIDSKEALQIEKEKELQKKNKSIWRFILLPMMACLVVAGYFGYVNTKDILESKNVVKSNNRYLSANYALKMYEEANTYIKDNVNLDKIKNNKSIKIKDTKFMDNKEEEYKYCSGSVIITKVNNGIYKYEIDSNCNNKSDYNISLTMKVFNNIDSNDKITKVNSINKNGTDGYSIALEGTRDDNGSYISGVIDITNDLDINNINYFIGDNVGNNSLIKLSDGYLAISSIDGEQHLSLFDNNLKFLWELYDIEYEIDNVLYDSKDFIYFSDNNKIFKMEKKDGTPSLVYELEYDLSESNYNVFSNNGILYGYNSNGGKSVFIYDLKGKVLRHININNYYDSDNKNISVLSSKDITLFANNHKALVINNKNEVVNTVMLDNSSDQSIYDLTITDEYYEISYDLENENNKKRYIRYSLDNSLMFNEVIDMEYGLSTLERMGLNVENMTQTSTIINGKLIETVYSKDNNGTLLVMSYDYGDSSNGQGVIIDEDNNDNNDTNEENFTAKSLIYVDSNVYNGLRIGLTTDKELILFKTNEQGLIRILGKMPYTFTGSNYADGYYVKYDGSQLEIRVDKYIKTVAERFGYTTFFFNNNGEQLASMEYVEDYVVYQSSKGVNSDVGIGITLDNKVIVYKPTPNGLQVRYKTDYYLRDGVEGYEIKWNSSENEPIRLRVDKYIELQPVRYSYTWYEFDKNGNLLSKKEYLDDFSFLLEDNKDYGGFKIGYTTGNELILFKNTDNGLREIYYSMPFYYQGTNYQEGYYADFNNALERKIRVRVDKYIEGRYSRYSYIWYTFNENGKLISTQEYLDYDSLEYIDNNNYGGYKIGMTVNKEFVLYREYNETKEIIYKLPYYYQGSYQDGYYADFNNSDMRQIRVRIDKYIARQSNRYSSLWYYFDQTGKLINTDEFLY